MSDSRIGLEAALREATLAVEAPGGVLGSGFFIAPRLVLTCAHTLAGKGEDLPAQIDGIWQGRRVQLEPVRLWWTPGWRGGPDLALLRAPQGLTDGYAPLVPEVQADDALWAFGYPGGAYRVGDSVTFRYEGPSFRVDGGYLLRVALGRATEGFSGAPVLNWRTGGVCGVLRLADTGGGFPVARLVPASVIISAYADVFAGPPDPAWLELLSDQQLRAGGWLFPDSHLKAYLKAARTAGRQHPYAIALPNAPQLTTVYLRQQVSAMTPPPQPPEELAHQLIPAPDRVGALPAAERRAAVAGATRLVQTFDPWDVLDRHRGILVLGGPGAGKSSLLRHIVATSADAWLDGGSEPFVPVLVHADALAGSLPLPDAVAEAVMHELGARLADSNLGSLFAEQPVSSTPWLILVDGIDEILDAATRTKVLETIVYWWSDQRYRFVVASRMLPQAELRSLSVAGMGIFEIQPFSSDELLVLAERWFTALGLSEVPQLVDRFVSQLLRSRLRQLARIPLIATAICVVFAADPGLELPPSRADLYESFINSLINKPFVQLNALERLQNRIRSYGEEPQRAVSNLLGRLRAFMQFLALSQLLENTAHLLIDDAERFATPERPSQLPDSTWRDILAEVLRQSGLLLQRGTDFIFIHQTVMEYLAACAVSGPRRLSHRHRLALALNAGRGESYSLFAVSVLHRDGTDLAHRAPLLLRVRRLIHARLVAALVNEGIVLERKIIEQAARRLTKVINRSQNRFSAALSFVLLGNEEDRVLAAKSLVLLNPDRGYAALARVAVDPAIGGYNIFDLLAQGTAEGEFTGFDRSSGMDALIDFATMPGQDNFYRVLITNLIFETDSDRGLPLIEQLVRDPTVDSVYRMECISRLLSFDQARGMDALLTFATDPRADLYLRFQASTQLSKLSLARYHAALESMATATANSAFARHLATVTLWRDRPSAGKPALLALAADKEVDGFHRVLPFDWPFGEVDAEGRLAELSSDPTLAGNWRMFAAEQLAIHDMGRGLAALRNISTDSSIRRQLRLRAMVTAWFYRLKIRFGWDL